MNIEIKSFDSVTLNGVDISKYVILNDQPFVIDAEIVPMTSKVITVPIGMNNRTWRNLKRLIGWFDHPTKSPQGKAAYERRYRNGAR